MAPATLIHVAAPHASQQASGFTRMLSVLTLIAGIAAMHVGIFTTPAAEHRLAASAVGPFATTHHAATAAGAGADVAPTPDHSADGDRTSDERAAIAAHSTAVGSTSAQLLAGESHESGLRALAADPASPAAEPSAPSVRSADGRALLIGGAYKEPREHGGLGSYSTTPVAVIDGTTGTQAAVIHSASAARPATINEFLATPSAEPGCADCGDGHAGPHACVFILTAFALAVLLVALYRICSGRPADGGGPKPRHWRPRRERPPPWTVLSLAELSILRI